MSATEVVLEKDEAALNGVERSTGARRLWRRSMVRAVVVPLVVLSPLVSMAPTADHRFNVYLNGGLYRNNPLRILPDNFSTMGHYLELGNFRPLGRSLEVTLDLLAFLLTDLLGLPVNVALRIVSFLAASLLSLAAFVLLNAFARRGRLFAMPPVALSAAVPFAVGAGLVAAGLRSTTILFGGLYMTSAAVVIAVAAGFLRAGSTKRTSIPALWKVGLVVLGAALASFNEIVYFALPFATVAVLLRQRFVEERRWRDVFGAASTRIVAWAWVGFIPVFTVTRAIIWNNCHGGGCYAGSDLVLSSDVLVALPNRLISWLPPLMWRVAAKGSAPTFDKRLFVAAAIALGLLAWSALRDVPHLGPVSRRGALAFAAMAGTLLLLGATLGALNGEVQKSVYTELWGFGWRDSSITPFAGGLAIIGLVGALPAHTQRLRQRAVVVLVVVFAAAAVVSALANREERASLAGQPDMVLANQVALAVADFDRSDAGNEWRCELRRRFYDMTPVPLARERFDDGLAAASRARAGMPFCAGRGP